MTVARTGGSIHDRVPFAYFQRLTRRQQGICLRSEKIPQVLLPGAAALRPLVAELGAHTLQMQGVPRTGGAR